MNIDKISSKIIDNTFGRINRLLHRKFDGSSVTNSKVLLVLLAKEDKNGALSLPRPISSWKIHHQKGLKVIYKTVGSVEDIKDVIHEIKDKGNRITGLWIDAHGNPSGISLDNENYISVNEREDLQDALSEMEPDSTIVLDSCETGNVNRARGNVSRLFASCASENTKVIAPIRDTRSSGFRVSFKDGKFGGTFTGPKAVSGNNFLARLKKVAYFCLFAFSFGRFGDNITATFKNYVPGPRRSPAEDISHSASSRPGSSKTF